MYFPTPPSLLNTAVVRSRSATGTSAVTNARCAVRLLPRVMPTGIGEGPRT
jgi:hypothetical protein